MVQGGGPVSRVLGGGARRPGVLSPRRGRQDARGPGQLPRSAVGRRQRDDVAFVDAGVRGARVRRLDRGHLQVPARVQQGPDAQRPRGRHETVHLVPRHHRCARVHELQNALHVFVADVLQDDRHAVARSGKSEEHRLQRYV